MSDDRYPHTCNCGHPCYKGGGNNIECTNPDCVNVDAEHRLPASMAEAVRGCIKVEPLDEPVQDNCESVPEIEPEHSRRWMEQNQERIQKNIPALSWPCTPPEGVTYTEHKFSFINILIRASNNIFSVLRVGTKDRVYCGSDVLSLIESLPGYRKCSDDSEREVLSQLGTLNGRWTIHSAIYPPCAFRIAHVPKLVPSPTFFTSGVIIPPEYPSVEASYGRVLIHLDKKFTPDERNALIAKWQEDLRLTAVGNPHDKLRATIRAAFETFLRETDQRITPGTVYEVRYNYNADLITYDKTRPRPAPVYHYPEACRRPCTGSYSHGTRSKLKEDYAKLGKEICASFRDDPPRNP